MDTFAYARRYLSRSDECFTRILFFSFSNSFPKVSVEEPNLDTPTKTKLVHSNLSLFCSFRFSSRSFSLALLLPWHFAEQQLSLLTPQHSSTAVTFTVMLLKINFWKKKCSRLTDRCSSAGIWRCRGQTNVRVFSFLEEKYIAYEWQEKWD